MASRGTQRGDVCRKCAAEIFFDLDTGTQYRNDPFRPVTTCDQCGTIHRLTPATGAVEISERVQ